MEVKMALNQSFRSSAVSRHRVSIDNLFDIAAREYGEVPERLRDLCSDVLDLYEGRWPDFEGCQIGYHTVGHALDVVLATARMVAGWNKMNPDRKIPGEIFLGAIAAAFLHDSGYLKNKGDLEGRGGKFTFNHVERSRILARQYLIDKKWPAPLVDLASRIILITEFNKYPDLGLFTDPASRAIACMVATADLVAQMADVDYMQSIKDLHEEFLEAYEFEGRDSLRQRGIHVFGSLQEVLDGTILFYENFVLPRLALLGRMDQYLIAFFEEGRNPYLENIAANLSGQLMNKRVQWRRLGDILQELGVVTSQQIEEALVRQRARKNTHADELSVPLAERLLAWMDTRSGCQCLGDFLMEMDVIAPSPLREGLLAQVLPPVVLQSLSRNELLALLRITMLLPNICKGQWILEQILEMMTEMLECEAGSFLLANPGQQEMVVIAQTGPGRHSQWRNIPLDKGLSGWVHRHRQPITLADVLGDERYNVELDHRIGLEVRSILAVPVFMNGESIGVMEVFNKREGGFDVHDMDVLTMLANVIATTLDCVIRLPRRKLDPPLVD